MIKTRAKVLNQLKTVKSFACTCGFVLSFLSTLFVFISLSFADPNIAASSSSAACKNSTLETYSGTSNLSANWNANTINLHWYADEDATTELTVPTTSQTCVYDSTLTPPPVSSVPQRTGYTFIGWKVRGLPDGYTRLQYIESTGTQYIYTGIKSNGIGLKTEVRMQLTTNTTDEQAIVGVKEDCSTYEIFFSGTSWSGAYHWSGGQRTGVSIKRTTGVMYTITSEMTSNGITHTVNGVQGSYSGSMADTSDKEVMLFGLCSRYRISARVYSVLIWKNGKLVRNYIPAKDSNDVVGLYDLVTKTFFTNAGTGVFTGPVAQ